MSRLRDQIPPDEAKIEELLSQFKPEPTSRYFQLLRAAPWQKPKHTRMPQALRGRNTTRTVVWSVVVLLLILLVGGTAFIPPIRAVASQIFHTFLAAPSNQIQVQVTLTSPGDVYSFTDPSNFPLSVGEAQLAAGFRVKQIMLIPEGFELVGAHYDRNYNTVILLYQDQPDYLTLMLTQRPVGNSQDVFSIGPEAVVKLVMIGDIQGELVQGGWQAASTQPVHETQSTGSEINIAATWDNDLPQSTLRWQMGNIAYELRASGYGGPSQSDLIKLANELK